MIIETKSGSTYEAELRQTARGPVLFVRKGKGGWNPAVAIFPNRYPHLMDTVSVVRQGKFVVGSNAAGRQTFRLIPNQIRRGMILASRHGLKSTEIVNIS